MSTSHLTRMRGAQTDPDVLTVDEAAELLRIGRNQLYDAIGRNEIPHLRIGRTIRLSRRALLAIVGGQRE